MPYTLHLQDTGETRRGRCVMVLTRGHRYQFWPVPEVRIFVHVPRGFVTDFATIPWFLWWLLPSTGRWRRAAVVHDWLCGVPGCHRFLADAVFRHVMQEDGVCWASRLVIYYAVRAAWELWGRWFWRKGKR